jgi:hypothetical protein
MSYELIYHLIILTENYYVKKIVELLKPKTEQVSVRIRPKAIGPDDITPDNRPVIQNSGDIKWNRNKKRKLHLQNLQ